MDLENFADRIGNLIGKDDLKTAIKEMGALLKSSNKLNEVILQSARLTDLMNQIRMGTISFQDANLNKNQIRYALLDLMREVEQNALKNPDVLEEIQAFKLPQAQTNIKQNHTGSGDNVGGDKIITNN